MQKTLESHGFVVQCVFPTKLSSIFQVEENGVLRSTIEGEANFRTNLGDIDVVFMPKPQTFADFKITERRQDHGYLYRFTGTPRVLAGDQFRFGTAYRQCYLKFDNQLVFDGDATCMPVLRTTWATLPTCISSGCDKLKAEDCNACHRTRRHERAEELLRSGDSRQHRRSRP